MTLNFRSRVSQNGGGGNNEMGDSHFRISEFELSYLRTPTKQADPLQIDPKNYKSIRSTTNRSDPMSANNIGVERAVGCAEFLNLISACAQFEIIDSRLPPRHPTYVILRWPSQNRGGLA